MTTPKPPRAQILAPGGALDARKAEFLEQFEAREASIRAARYEDRVITPFARSLMAKVAKHLEAQEEDAGRMPVVSTFDLYQCVKRAASSSQRDRGMKYGAQLLKNMWDRDPTGSLTHDRVAEVKNYLHSMFPKSRVASAIDSAIARVGFHKLPVAKLTRIASQIDSQESYESLMRVHGYADDSDMSKRARALVRQLVEMRGTKLHTVAAKDERTAFERAVERLIKEAQVAEHPMYENLLSIANELAFGELREYSGALARLVEAVKGGDANKIRAAIEGVKPALRSAGSALPRLQQLLRGAMMVATARSNPGMDMPKVAQMVDEEMEQMDAMQPVEEPQTGVQDIGAPVQDPAVPSATAPDIQATDTHPGDIMEQADQAVTEVVEAAPPEAQPFIEAEERELAEQGFEGIPIGSAAYGAIEKMEGHEGIPGAPGPLGDLWAQEEAAEHADDVPVYDDSADVGSIPPDDGEFDHKLAEEALLDGETLEARNASMRINDDNRIELVVERDGKRVKRTASLLYLDGAIRDFHRITAAQPRPMSGRYVIASLIDVPCAGCAEVHTFKRAASMDDTYDCHCGHSVAASEAEDIEAVAGLERTFAVRASVKPSSIDALVKIAADFGGTMDGSKFEFIVSESQLPDIVAALRNADLRPLKREAQMLDATDPNGRPGAGMGAPAAPEMPSQRTPAQAPGASPVVPPPSDSVVPPPSDSVAPLTPQELQTWIQGKMVETGGKLPNMLDMAQEIKKTFKERITPEVADQLYSIVAAMTAPNPNAGGRGMSVQAGKLDLTDAGGDSPLGRHSDGKDIRFRVPTKKPKYPRLNEDLGPDSQSGEAFKTPRVSQSPMKGGRWYAPSDKNIAVGSERKHFHTPSPTKPPYTPAPSDKSFKQG